MAPGYSVPMHLPLIRPDTLFVSLQRLLLMPLAAAILWGAPAHAVEVEDLYEARVEVRGQGEGEREAGFRTALERVIVRVSGRSGAPGDPELEPIVDNPGRYVQTYRYRAIDSADREDASAEATEDSDGDGEEAPTHYLEVSFNGDRIESDLRETGIVIWGERRPEVLLWVAVDDDRDRYIVAADEGEEARGELREHARRRGLPLLLPLLDLEDQRRIDFIDIRAPFLDAVREAGERYRAEVMLVGHVQRHTEDDWSADWTLLADDREAAWQVQGRARDAMLDAGITGATDRLAAMLAGHEDDATRLHITVEAVDSLADYSRVADYIAGLVRVRSSELERVTPDAARFRVEIQGEQGDLERSISLGDLLEPVAAPTGAAEPGSGPDADDADALDALVDELRESGDGDGRRAAEPDQAGPMPIVDPAVELFYRLAG